MDIVPVSPDDLALCGAVAELKRAVRVADGQDYQDATAAKMAGWLAHGWHGEPVYGFVMVDGGLPVGWLEVSTTVYDNLDFAWLELEVHPDHRRAGRGSRLLAHGLQLAKELGRPSVGTASWDGVPAGPAFAARHGFEQKSVEVLRRQYLDQLDETALARTLAGAPAEGYEMLRIRDVIPDDLLDAYVELKYAMNDAPKDDLEIEDAVFTRERARANERVAKERNRRTYFVLARRVADGELGGFTFAQVDGERPWLGDQGDTGVARAHRGHRLGLAVKGEMLRWLREEEPQLRQLDTWNAESNDHMIAVNEALQYRVVGRAFDYQRRL